VTIAAITGYALLKIVGRQVVHELSEYSLVGIHPSLSAIWSGLRSGSFARKSARKLQIEKTAILSKLQIMRRLHGFAKL
jgi:folate-dependent phosphoribosylglycinamide formyltransferase PurN